MAQGVRPPGGGQCGQWRTGLGPALRAKSTSRAGSPVDPPAQWVRGLKSRRAGKICRLQPAKMAAALTTQSCELPLPNPRPVHAQFTASRRQTAQPDPTALSRRDTSPAISSRPHPLGAMEPEQQPGYDASCATLPLLGRPERPNQASQGRRRRRGLAASQQLRPGCVRTCVYFLSPFSCISSRWPGPNTRDWMPVESSRPESMTRLTRSRHAALEFPRVSVALGVDRQSHRPLGNLPADPRLLTPECLRHPDLDRMGGCWVHLLAWISVEDRPAPCFL